MGCRKKHIGKVYMHIVVTAEFRRRPGSLFPGKDMTGENLNFNLDYMKEYAAQMWDGAAMHALGAEYQRGDWGAKNSKTGWVRIRFKVTLPEKREAIIRALKAGMQKAYTRLLQKYFRKGVVQIA
jgi:hypothetical protein